MEPHTRTRSVVTTIATAAALAAVGCNSLLDNRPADVNADLFATAPTGDGGALREAGRNADASLTDPAKASGGNANDADGGTEPLAPQCLVGTKPCGDVCVSVDDPYYGCAGPTCERCAPSHGAGACVAGQCAPGTCATGWADCNGLPSDGCEADLSSVATCGACGVACAAAPNADSACAAGACETTCVAGFGDCNHNAADGCETQLLDDKHNCGECGHRCIVGVCEAGNCVWKL
ncbi:MAG: hypothetical protein QOI41_3423 [Myxococcales bacterium]|jgi:hypothetical protein|nr:hypothetical protein [Myxococcales bacterium]